MARCIRIGTVLLVALALAGAVAAESTGLYKVDRILGDGWNWKNRQEPGFFHYPQSITIDEAGNLYVVDRDNNRIQGLRPDGANFMTIGVPWDNKQYTKPIPTGPDVLRNPYGVAVDGGSIYITDWAKHRILRFGTDGKFIAQWGYETPQYPALHYPSAIYADGQGNLYVGHEKSGSSQNGNPMIFDRDGKFKGYTALPGMYGFVRAPDGCMFQSFQSRIYKIGKDGKLIGWIGRAHQPLRRTNPEVPGRFVPADETYPNGPDGGYWCSAGDGPSEFRDPRALAIDAKRGRLFVCDVMNHRVQIFDLDGKYLGVIGKRGTDKGQFLCPVGIAVDKNGAVYVADKYNNRVQVFRPADEGEPKK